MAGAVQYYEALLEECLDAESTVLVVAGATRAEVADVLGVDLATGVADGDLDDVDHTGWALDELTGPDGSTAGVLALEPTGFGDPATETLVRLSADGGAAAVVRGNVDGRLRFGCAREGSLLFDDDEYPYIEDTDRLPEDLRELFDLVPDDLEDDLGGDDPAEGASGYAVGLAMAEKVTGLAVTADDVRRASGSGYFRAPSLVYEG